MRGKKKKIGIVIFIVFILFLICNKYIVKIEKTKHNATDNQYFNVTEENGEEREYSKLYQQYLELSEEEKAKIAVIPRMYDVPMDVLYEKEEEPKKSLWERLLSLFKSSEAEELPESYVLLKDENIDLECQEYGGIDIQVENQGADGLCWAFASLTPLETNLALQNKNYELSERHLDYLTSTEFGGDRELGLGGNFYNFQQYIKRKYGPVLESEVPYNKKHSAEEYDFLLSLETLVNVNKTIDFPTVFKGENSFYTDEEMQLLRQKVKKHIMENGGVYAAICSSKIRMYNGKSVLNAASNTIPDHAITIIGWDDNFSTENFLEDNRPTSNGAYIALNSWGEDWGENGIFYISYEDAWVECDMSGIVEANTKDVIYDTIKFEDENLYNAMKEILEKNIVSYNDSKKEMYLSKRLSDITSLYLGNKNISNISGLEKLTNLCDLYLWGNNITDISPLGDLTGLYDLDLSGNNITNISSLEDLTKLSYLDLSDNNITDISVLEALTNLETICLSNNNVTNVSGLEKLPYLMDLYLDGNNIENIGDVIGLDKLTNLTYLDLSNNNITDISGLEKITSLESLVLSNNNVTNVTGLEQIPYLTYLCLEGNNIENIGDVTGLDKLIGLYSLDLSNNNITDVSGLEKITNLGEIYLSNNNITDISGLEQIPYLCYLYLDGNNITDISSLKKITKLYFLDLSNNNITDVSGLEGLMELEAIYLNNNNVTNISGLEQIPYLRELYLDGNDITDTTEVIGLDKLNNVERLSLSNNNITNVSGLEKLTNLQQLDLSYNNITDLQNVSGLEKLTNLIGLGVSDNNITDVRALEKLTNLMMINLSNNNITDVTALKNLTNLMAIDLSNNNVINIENITAELIIGENLEGTVEITIEKDKENVIELPQIMNLAFLGGMYGEKTGFNCENCTINPTATKVTIIPNDFGEGQAKITIQDGAFDGTTYTIKYNAVGQVNVTDIKVKTGPTKSHYIEKQDFDSNGLVVEVTYENGLVEETTDYTIVNGQNLSAGQENVIIRSNKNPEIEIEYAITVYGENEVEVMQFPDDNLYKSIKDESIFEEFARLVTILEYDDEENIIIMPKENIENITMIFGQSKDIADITGLEKFTNLETVILSHNTNLMSIEPLQQLSNLMWVELFSTSVDDIGGLLTKETVTRIGLRKEEQEIIETNTQEIELPQFIYQSLTMQENVTAEAAIYYNVGSFDNGYHYIDYEGGKKTVEVLVDREKQIAKIELDSEITGEHLAGIRGIEVIINGGKTEGVAYIAFYEVANEDAEKLKVTINKYEEKQDENLRYIKNIAPETSIGEVLSNIETNGTIEIYKGTEKITDMDEIIATGMTITIKLNDEKIEYAVVVKGDLNGDGKVKLSDLSKLKLSIIGNIDLQGAYKEAADLNGDGKVKLSDLSKMKLYLVGMSEL